MEHGSAVAGLFAITVNLLSIVFIWVLLQDFKWDRIFHRPRGVKSRMFQVVAAVIIGHLFSQFILQYWDYTSMLKGFLQ
ncbi:DUF1146 domain-containing protein [Paenibacillus yanchengensis]|uniref:DUF1146 domain-containing protein n=1 Tax=Paenibacillus yanchengensis TaxID=2035833 RepID=A0ABW4YMZ6_9BACL